VTLLALIPLLAAPLAGVAQETAKEKFTGFAINLNSGPRTATVDFTIERWSTDAERTTLLNAITTEKDAIQSNNTLLRLLQKMPRTGTIRTANTLAWDLHYAHQSELENGGRRIVLATDRPINFQEARNQTRTLDYPFTIVEIHLDKEDKGTGKILAGTKLYIDKNKTLVLENWGQQPIRFNEIHKVK
jgi:hypothetical protein